MRTFAANHHIHTIAESDVAQIVVASNLAALNADEIECWQRAIDSNLIWQMPRAYGTIAVTLIERKVCTRARRSYSGARVNRLSIYGVP